jgi:DNA-binding HxlR family transcriptional regulator
MATTRRAKSRKRLQAAEICEALDADQEGVIREILSRVTDKWSLWALSELKSDGPLRFSRLLERVEGVSQKSLTATLRGLERAGLVRRTVTVQVPIRVDYEATSLGRELIARFQPFWIWTVGKISDFRTARQAFDAARSADSHQVDRVPNRNAR